MLCVREGGGPIEIKEKKARPRRTQWQDDTGQASGREAGGTGPLREGWKPERAETARPRGFGLDQPGAPKSGAPEQAQFSLGLR